MADLNLNGHTKVKTFKAKFRETFGATLRVYKDVACQEGFADDEATLAAIRTAGAKGGELTVRSHMQVGNFEKKVAKLYGIGIQIANAEDTELVDDSITLSEVGSVTTTKTSENSLKKNHVRIEIEYTEYEYAPIDEDGAMIGDSVAFCFHEYSDTEIYIDDELSDEEAETEFSGYKPYKFEETERMGCWVNSVREVYYLNVENFDASKLVMYYDCYDVPYNNRTREVSFISLKYDGKVIESDQESYSCKNKDFLEISIPTEFVKESTIIDEKPAELSMSLSEKFGILATTLAGMDNNLQKEEVGIALIIAGQCDRLNVDEVRTAIFMELKGIQEYESQSKIVKSIQGDDRELIFRSLVLLAISDWTLSQVELQFLGGIADVWGWDWDDCIDMIHCIIENYQNAHPGKIVEIEE
jgi:hypothetical protein